MAQVSPGGGQACVCVCARAENGATAVVVKNRAAMARRAMSLLPKRIPLRRHGKLLRYLLNSDAEVLAVGGEDGRWRFQTCYLLLDERQAGCTGAASAALAAQWNL